MNKRTHAWTLGSERRAVGFAGTDPAVEAAARWKRTPTERRACRAERGLVDFGHRGVAAGDAEEVSSLSDLPAALSAVGAVGGAGEGVVEAGATTVSRRLLESGGSLHRRDVCGVETASLGVGLAKRGKGTKITAVTVGDSVPIAVPCASCCAPRIATRRGGPGPQLPRRTARETDRRQSLRQRPVRPTPVETLRGGTDCSAPQHEGPTRPKTVVVCAATVDAGPSSACLPGCKCFAAWLRATSTTSEIYWDWSDSDA